MTTLAAIQSWPEVPALAHFCSLFKTAFDLLEFEIEELETALLSVDSVQEDMFACTLLERLVVRLLRGCLPATIAAQVHEGNFSLYLRQLLETKQEEAEEEGQMYSFRDPFQDSDIEEFEDLSAHSQVRVVCQLTQFRLEAGDAGERLRDLDPDGMRVEPLGEDSEGVTYWYFFGVRLYREVGERKPKKVRKKKEDKDQQDCNPKQSTAIKAKQSKKKKGVAEAVEDAAGGLLGFKVDEDEVLEEEVEEVPREAPGWYVACNSEADWADLTARYKKSKKRSDRELHEVLAENFLPEITKMFQDKEKEEKIKVMMMNKRSSGRLDRKRTEKEKEFEERRQEEEQRELERRAEEEKRRKREKENKLKGRSERAQKREFEPAPIGQLLANRKRGREEGRGSVRDVVEEDHDYTRRRNPALREWQRLASSDKDKEEEGEGREGRNLRL